MCIYSPMPHTLSYCALIGKCALIRSNTVHLVLLCQASLWAVYMRSISGIFQGNKYLCRGSNSSIFIFASLVYGESTLIGKNLLIRSKFFPLRVDPHHERFLTSRETNRQVIKLLSLGMVKNHSASLQDGYL